MFLYPLFCTEEAEGDKKKKDKKKKGVKEEKKKGPSKATVKAMQDALAKLKEEEERANREEEERRQRLEELEAQRQEQVSGKTQSFNLMLSKSLPFLPSSLKPSSTGAYRGREEREEETKGQGEKRKAKEGGKAPHQDPERGSSQSRSHAARAAGSG